MWTHVICVDCHVICVDCHVICVDCHVDVLFREQGAKSRDLTDTVLSGSTIWRGWSGIGCRHFLIYIPSLTY